MNRIALLLALIAALAGSSVAAQTVATPFQVGDRVLLHVEGDSVLSDTFTVVTGPALRLPEIGEISLHGVPRTEIEAHLTKELARFLKDPVVEARALIRVSVLGEVVRPGYYAVPVDLVLADALMVAGGATTDARVEQLKIMRGSAALWSGNRLQSEIARGATLEQLGMRAGDRIQIPRSHHDPESKWRIAGIVITSLATAVTVIALTR
ncbi:MAG TPA: SLBB domain-containing protein [Gemmatimonadales bacterium]|nr:SLBB domain-containing protein [Gemmatimonadales bacterium]